MNNSFLVWISAFRWKSSDTCSRDLLRIPMTPMMMIRTAFDGDPRDSREPVIPNHFSFSTPPQTTASPPPTWKCNLVAGAKLCPLLLKWSYKNHEFFVFSIFDISMLVPCAHKSQTLDSIFLWWWVVTSGDTLLRDIQRILTEAIIILARQAQPTHE